VRDTRIGVAHYGEKASIRRVVGSCSGEERHDVLFPFVEYDHDVVRKDAGLTFNKGTRLNKGTFLREPRHQQNRQVPGVGSIIS